MTRNAADLSLKISGVFFAHTRLYLPVLLLAIQASTDERRRAASYSLISGIIQSFSPLTQYAAGSL
ncbi:hypothetical protein BH11PSE12_BH11PSE12_15470 [soil metagenome]